MNKRQITYWKTELVVGMIRTAVLTLAFVVTFVMLGGFHGSAGKFLMMVTAPIGFFHAIGIGDSVLGATLALVTQVCCMLGLVLIMRAIWRRYLVWIASD
ncbi:MAG TPA: hypothetical protein VNW52_00980 [Burkholderiaceae bacterium]|jgi:hypothetical protein|nr:hypothetical protein [Burkholderiaceae bacterium]